MKTASVRLVGLLAVALILHAAFAQTSALMIEKQIWDKELLVYWGIMMIRPTAETARAIEEHEGCELIISRGGSDNRLCAFKANEPATGRSSTERVPRSATSATRSEGETNSWVRL